MRGHRVEEMSGTVTTKRVRSQQLSVVLVHNAPTPYRLPLFEDLATDYRLYVWFCAAQEPGRAWATDLSATTFESTISPATRIGRLIVSWSLPLAALRRHADVVVLAEDPANLLTSLAVAALCRYWRIPLVLWTEHVLGSSGGRRRGPAVAVFRATHRLVRRWLLAESVAVISMSGAASTAELESLSSRLPPVFSGGQVMPEKLMPGRLPRATGNGTTILFLGYLRPEKNVEALIRAFIAVSGPDDRLVVVGDGPERHKLQQVAEADGRIVFRGHLSGASRDAQLASADALVLPSTYEPWGLVVNESLYAGVPVLVCRDVGSAELVVDGTNGLLFSWDPAGSSLRMVLRSFLADGELRKRLTAGAERASKETLSDVRLGTRHIAAAVEAASRRAGSAVSLQAGQSGGQAPSRCSSGRRAGRGWH